VESAKIVGFCIVAAMLYGIVHDQITARICIEYFTIGHPLLLHSRSPALLGLVWGVVATWWVGAVLGLLLAVAARSGVRAPQNLLQLRAPILCLVAIVAFLAAITGLVTYRLAIDGHISLPKDWASVLPERARIPFLVDVYTHAGSYAFGILGAVILAVLTYRRRLSSVEV
jgi:hypothetical protein